MLSPDEIKPFLCHEQKRIREHAVDYFAKSHSKDDDLMPLIIESCIKYGEEDNSLLLAKASNFVQSEESLETITKWLEKSNNTNSLFHYNSIIAAASIDTLEPQLLRLKRGKNVFRETIDRINRRIALSSYTTNALWENLLEYCKEVEGKKVNEFDYSYGHNMIEALANRNDLPTEEIINYLEEKHSYGYDEIYLTILAGEAGIEKAFFPLIDKLRIDTDLLCEEAAKSLEKIGTKKVIDELRNTFLKEEGHFKIFAVSIFGNIKLPSSEDAILEILPREKEIDIKTFLAMGLCDLISKKGVSHVKSMVEKGEYDGTIVDLRKPLYSTCIMLELEFDELKEWKKALDEEEEKRRQHQKQLEEGLGSPEALFENLKNLKKKMGTQKHPNKEKKKQKIGRNEPCPCGSGKKYKKCCL